MRRKKQVALADPITALVKSKGFKKWLRGPTQAEKKAQSDIERVEYYLTSHGLPTRHAKKILADARRRGIRLNQIEKAIIIPEYTKREPIKIEPKLKVIAEPTLARCHNADQTAEAKPGLPTSRFDEVTKSAAARASQTGILRQIATAILRSVLGSMAGGRRN